jgi:lipopolysaccharide biosynthesis protein
MASLSDRWRRWRRRLKAALPYVRRREYRVLERIHAELIEAVDGGATPAASAPVTVRKPFAADLAGEVALFVTHAGEPALKPHVVRHIERLRAAGWRVLLIVNTDLPVERIGVDATLLAALDGLWVRANVGFDFGAWAHALQACDPMRDWTRLLLVNDSIVGPLDDAAFAALLGRVRTSSADLVGLTEGLAPRRHLQSYFLVLQHRALASPALRALFARVQNWPSKGQVIDLYERRLTAIAEADGLSVQTLFPSLSGDPLASDDTSLRWAELVAAGFPFLKSRVISKHRDDPRVRAWLGASGLG